MFKKVKDFFQGDATLVVDTTGKPTDRDLQIAIGVLLLEAAGSDEDYDPVEVKTAFRILEQEFGMGDEEVLALLENADSYRSDKEKIDTLVKAINQHFDVNQKQLIMSMVWKVIMADGKIEKAERRLARQLQTRLQLTEVQAEAAMKMSQED